MQMGARMLIVPELETVFILVPRTGTGTLYREVLRVYPKAMLLYRHMEADGCPQGYDRWRKVGVVRNPLMRLWSLYKFMKGFEGGALIQNDADKLRARRQVEGKTFEDWLLHNCEPWTAPFDLNGTGQFWPVLSRRHAAPENRISQFAYLRPDLGTEIRKFDDLPAMLLDFGLNPATVKNSSGKDAGPEITPAIKAHITQFCAWDVGQECED